MDDDIREDGIVELEIDGMLDLHTFSPKDIKHLVPDYLDACLKKNISEVRIIHGKGRGVLKRTVHSLLEKLPCVVSFTLATRDQGNWGATIVELRAPDNKSEAAVETEAEKR